MPRIPRTSAKTLSVLALLVGLGSWPCVASGWVAFEISGIRTRDVAFYTALCVHVLPFIAIALGHLARARGKADRPPTPTGMATVGLVSSYVLVLTPLACALALAIVWGLIVLRVFPGPTWGALPGH